MREMWITPEDEASGAFFSVPRSQARRCWPQSIATVVNVFARWVL